MLSSMAEQALCARAVAGRFPRLSCTVMLVIACRADAVNHVQCMFHAWRDCFPLFHGYTTLLMREAAKLKAPPDHSSRVLVRMHSCSLIPHQA